MNLTNEIGFIGSSSTDYKDATSFFTELYGYSPGGGSPACRYDDKSDTFIYCGRHFDYFRSSNTFDSNLKPHFMLVCPDTKVWLFNYGNLSERMHQFMTRREDVFRERKELRRQQSERRTIVIIGVILVAFVCLAIGAILQKHFA